MKVDITSSKFYIASDHKERITASYNSIFNRGLVVQHPEQLSGGDDAVEDLKDEEDAKARENEPDVSKHESFGDHSGPATRVGVALGPAQFVPSAESDISSTPESSNSESKETTSESETKADESTASSVSIPAKPVVDTDILKDTKQDVKAQTTLYSDSFARHSSLAEETNSLVDVIKGQLNITSDTSGVRYCSVVEGKELWIYYEDKINLNDVMEPVIKLLCQADYDWLTFSRLARKDNAIVFDINSTGKQNDVRQPEEKSES